MVNEITEPVRFPMIKESMTFRGDDIGMSVDGEDYEEVDRCLLWRYVKENGDG